MILCVLAGVGLPSVLPASDDRGQSQTVIGPRNPDLYNGGQELQAGNAEDGIRLTKRGLAAAVGRREQQAAYNNLCAGYLMLRNWNMALDYCNQALELSPSNWRSLSNRAYAYVQLERYNDAEADLDRGQQIAPQSEKLKEVRGIWRDAVEPVAPTVEIDDRRSSVSDP